MVKQKNDWHELSVDGMVIALYFMQQAMLHEFNRAYRNLGSYFAKPDLHTTVELCLTNVEFIPLESIIERVKNGIKGWYEPFDPIPKPGFKMSVAFLARMCLEHNMVVYVPQFRNHVVMSPFTPTECHVVTTAHGKHTCSCECKACHHVLAVKLFTGTIFC